jgi:curved DNA-binding protein CbpA
MIRHTYDPYAVLGLSPDATPAEITAAYRALVRALHPDTHHQSGGPQALADVYAAYHILRDPGRRAIHDQQRRRYQARPPARLAVRVHPTPAGEPELRAGPVHWYPLP